MTHPRPGVRWQRSVAALTYWVAVPAAVLGVGHAVDRWLGLPGMGWRRFTVGLGSALILGGVALIARAIRELVRLGEGTPSPSAPPRVLVTSGVYAWCRHPMFLGYDLAALGVILVVSSWGALLLCYPIFLGLQVGFLRSEEERLVRRFGAAYRAYRMRTPLLIPRFSRHP